MRVERKTDTGNSVIRLFFVVLAIAAQVYFLYILIAWLNGYSTWIHIVTEIIAVLLVLLIYGNHNLDEAAVGHADYSRPDPWRHPVVSDGEQTGNASDEEAL